MNFIRLGDKHRATTLLETTISIALFSVMIVVLFGMVRMGTDSMQQAETRSNLQETLRKVEVYLLDDLRRTSIESVQVGKIKVDGAGSYEANCLWLLSAYGSDKNSGGQEVFSRDSTGSVLWKRNILYYVAPLTNEWHQERFGYVCEDLNTCPHKWLVRKEILVDKDGNCSGGGVVDPTKPIRLLGNSATQIGAFVNGIKSFDLSYMLNDAGSLENPGCKKAIALADCVLEFDVKLPTNDGGIGATSGAGITKSKKYGASSASASGDDYVDDGSVVVLLRAFNFEEARRNMTVGKKEDASMKGTVTSASAVNANNRFDIASGRYIMQYEMRVIPNN